MSKTVATVKERKKRAVAAFLTEEIGEELNDRQKLFVILYLTDKDCSHNATKSYMAAYNLKESQRNSARQAGYRLLTNVHIQNFKAKVLAEAFAGVVVENEHAKLIIQDRDLTAKGKGIDMYYKVKGAYGGEEEDRPPILDLTEQLDKIYGPRTEQAAIG